MEKNKEGKFFRRLQELNEQNEKLKEDINTIQKIFDYFLVSITLKYGSYSNEIWELSFSTKDVLKILHDYNIRVSIDEENQKQVVKVVKRKEEE